MKVVPVDSHVVGRSAGPASSIARSLNEERTTHADGGAGVRRGATLLSHRNRERVIDGRPGQAVARRRPGHCSATFEPGNCSPPGLRATAPDARSSLVRRLRLLDPREPPVGQHENMVGLDLFSALAHQSKKVGRRFQDGHATDFTIARGRGRACLGCRFENLNRTNEAFTVQLETNARAAVGQFDGMEPGDVPPVAPNLYAAIIGALDDAFHDIGGVAVAGGHELASIDVARPARRASAAAMRSRSSAMSAYSRLPNGHSTGT